MVRGRGAKHQWRTSRAWYWRKSHSENNYASSCSLRQSLGESVFDGGVRLVTLQTRLLLYNLPRSRVSDVRTSLWVSTRPRFSLHTSAEATAKKNNTLPRVEFELAIDGRFKRSYVISWVSTPVTACDKRRQPSAAGGLLHIIGKSTFQVAKFATRSLANLGRSINGINRFTFWRVKDRSLEPWLPTRRGSICFLRISSRRHFEWIPTTGVQIHWSSTPWMPASI